MPNQVQLFASVQRNACRIIYMLILLTFNFKGCPKFSYRCLWTFLCCCSICRTAVLCRCLWSLVSGQLINVVNTLHAPRSTPARIHLHWGPQRPYLSDQAAQVLGGQIPTTKSACTTCHTTLTMTHNRPPCICSIISTTSHCVWSNPPNILKIFDLLIGPIFPITLTVVGILHTPKKLQHLDYTIDRAEHF